MRCTRRKNSIFPDDVFATAFAINAASSTGFLVLNPGHVDPGYKGPLTVFAINIGSAPNRIAKAEAVFKLVFERLPAAAQQGYAKRHKLLVGKADLAGHLDVVLAAARILDRLGPLGDAPGDGYGMAMLSLADAFVTG